MLPPFYFCPHFPLQGCCTFPGKSEETSELLLYRNRKAPAGHISMGFMPQIKRGHVFISSIIKHHTFKSFSRSSLRGVSKVMEGFLSYSLTSMDVITDGCCWPPRALDGGPQNSVFASAASPQKISFPMCIQPYTVQFWRRYQPWLHQVGILRFNRPLNDPGERF